MVLFLVFFLLVTGDLFKRKLVKIAGPTLTKKKITIQIMDDINRQVSGFLRVQVMTSAVVGVLTGIALWLFGVRQFVIWGVLAGIFNSIPYLGPLIVTGGLGAKGMLWEPPPEDAGSIILLFLCVLVLLLTLLEWFFLQLGLEILRARVSPDQKVEMITKAFAPLQSTLQVAGDIAKIGGK